MLLHNGTGCLNKPLASGVTDANGTVIFPNLPVGSYSVAEVLQAGWTPVTGICRDVVLGPNNSPGNPKQIKPAPPVPSKAQPNAAKPAARGKPATPLDVIIPGSPISITVRPSGSYAVYRNGIQQFYGGNAEGVYLWVPDVANTPTPLARGSIVLSSTVWGPEQVPAGNPVNLYTPIGQPTLTGDGSPGNPWVVTAVLGVGNTGLQLTQRTIYVNGQERVRNEWSLCNAGPNILPGVHIFHAADLYTTGDDAGYGYYDASTGAIGGYNRFRTLYQVFVPVNPSDKYQEDVYRNIWDAIGSTAGPGLGFQNSYLPDTYIDNGAGLEWIRSFDTGQCVTLADYLSFTSTPQALVVFRNIPPFTTSTPTATPTLGPSVNARTNQVIELPEDGVVTSDLEVNGSGVISDISLIDLNLEKRSDRFVTAYLQAPNGQQVQVFNWPQCKGSAYAMKNGYMKGVTLDDAAQKSLPYGCDAVISGTYRSDPGLLRKFAGTALTGWGKWKLVIHTGPIVANTPTVTATAPPLPLPANTDTPTAEATKVDKVTVTPKATENPPAPAVTAAPTKQLEGSATPKATEELPVPAATQVEVSSTPEHAIRSTGLLIQTADGPILVDRPMTLLRLGSAAQQIGRAHV